jgi:CDP-diacylglycerol--glycerol-3-phosphate 3-phosphatidyltransferase/cardiolipin synthase
MATEASVYRARDLVRVPGLLSLARLPLAIVFPLALNRPVLAIAVMAAAALSDVLDGWYARAFAQQTAMGAVLDGLMDKVFVVTMLSTLVVRGWLPPLHALLLCTRELGELPLLVSAIAHREWRSPVRPSANAVGKLTTVLQFATVLAVVLRVEVRNVLVYVTAVCGALAALLYWNRRRT